MKDKMIEETLRHTTDTKACEIGAGAVSGSAAMFRSLFPGKKAIVVADANTWRVAGKEVQAALEASATGAEKPFVFTDPELFAEGIESRYEARRLQIGERAPM